MTDLPHLNAAGEAHIVDISDKTATQRIAVTEGYIRMEPETLAMIVNLGHKKGDVLALARIAGIMAAKKTAELIPLCHPIAITHINIELMPDADNNRVRCETTVKTLAPTGVEMEALTATQIALLTIYDMCKAKDRGMVIESVRLMEKTGGKSGHWLRQ
jgi:cyclic pyranopterin monophosphate synthase